MLKAVDHIRLVSEFTSDAWTTTRTALGKHGTPLLVRISKSAATLGPDAEARLEREVAASREAREERVISVLEAGVSSSMPWVAHPWFEGHSLAALLEDHPGPLPAELVMLIGFDVASALAAAETVELLHRSVSVDTIWIDRASAQARVLGWALSTICVDVAAELPPLREAMKPFASPEHEAPASLTASSDLYSLAATLTALHDGASVDAAGLATDLPPLAGLPEEAAEAIRAALSTDPAERGTAATLRKTLRDALADEREARKALGEHFDFPIGASLTLAAPDPSTPELAIPLDDVTKKQLLPEAIANLRSYRAASVPPPQLDLSALLAPLDEDPPIGGALSLDDMDNAATTQMVLPEHCDWLTPTYVRGAPPCGDDDEDEERPTLRFVQPLATQVLPPEEQKERGIVFRAPQPNRADLQSARVPPPRLPPTPAPFVGPAARKTKPKKRKKTAPTTPVVGRRRRRGRRSFGRRVTLYVGLGILAFGTVLLAAWVTARLTG